MIAQTQTLPTPPREPRRDRLGAIATNAMLAALATVGRTALTDDDQHRIDLIRRILDVPALTQEQLSAALTSPEPAVVLVPKAQTPKHPQLEEVGELLEQLPSVVLRGPEWERER